MPDPITNAITDQAARIIALETVVHELVRQLAPNGFLAAAPDQIAKVPLAKEGSADMQKKVAERLAYLIGQATKPKP